MSSMRQLVALVCVALCLVEGAAATPYPSEDLAEAGGTVFTNATITITAEGKL